MVAEVAVGPYGRAMMTLEMASAYGSAAEVGCAPASGPG